MTTTIHDMIDLHTDRIARLRAHRRIVRQIDVAGSAPFAADVRERLLGVLGEMIYEERDALKEARRYLRNTTEVERAKDDAVDPDFYEHADTFAENWDGQSLLDSLQIDAEAGEAYDPIQNRTYPVSGSYPLRLPLADELLGGIASAIRAIEDDLDIRFTVERIFLDEGELTDLIAAMLERLE